MLNSVFVGSNGVIVSVPLNQGNAILMRDYFVSDADAAGYPEDFFETISEAALEDMGAEYLAGRWENA